MVKPTCIFFKLRHSTRNDHSYREITSTVLSLLTLFALFLPIQVHSAQPYSTHQEIELTRAIINSRILLEKLMMNYHLSTAQQANPKYQSNARLAAEQIEAELKGINSTLRNVKLSSESHKIGQSWSDFKTILKTNLTELESTGYAELQVVDNMVARARFFDNTLQFAYNRVKGNAQININQNAEAARSLSRLLQHIANKYAERAASVTGTAARAQGEETAIDELAEQFIQQLKTLKKSTANTHEVKEKLRQVEMKWKYIEKSLQNYTENSISFLVTYYSHDMVDLLLGVASIYERS